MCTPSQRKPYTTQKCGGNQMTSFGGDQQPYQTRGVGHYPTATYQRGDTGPGHYQMTDFAMAGHSEHTSNPDIERDSYSNTTQQGIQGDSGHRIWTNYRVNQPALSDERVQVSEGGRQGPSDITATRNPTQMTRLSVALDEKRMMRKHASYHHSITGEEAERRLKMCGSPCYLTRFSENQFCYVLTVYRPQLPKDMIKHFKIIIESDSSHKIEGLRPFGTIEELLLHYESNRIDPAFDTIGKYFTEAQYNTVDATVRPIQEERKHKQWRDKELKLAEEQRKIAEENRRAEELKVERLKLELEMARSKEQQHTPHANDERQDGGPRNQPTPQASNERQDERPRDQPAPQASDERQDESPREQNKQPAPQARNERRRCIIL